MFYNPGETGGGVQKKGGERQANAVCGLPEVLLGLKESMAMSPSSQVRLTIWGRVYMVAIACTFFQGSTVFHNI